MNIIIIIPISIVIIVVWHAIAPSVIPLFDDVHKSVRQWQGRCPDVALESRAYSANTTGWFGERYCNQYIQLEITNKGKGEALSTQVSCVIRDPKGLSVAWADKNIGDLRANERRLSDIMIGHDCRAFVVNHSCTTSFDDPCL